jgi:hypothetical protein
LPQATHRSEGEKERNPPALKFGNHSFLAS